MTEIAQFTTPLCIEKIGAHRWILTDHLRYRTKVLNGGFVVPRGFQTDLASIPRPLWVIAPKVDVYDPAVVLHDAAYGNALLTWDLEHRVFLVKEWADQLFYEALLVCGVRTARARLMYAMVIAFGDPAGHPLVRT